MSVKTRILVILAALVVSLGLGWAISSFVVPDGAVSKVASTVTSGGATLIGGPFELTDEHGKRRRDAEFRGKLMLIYFGYTFCPDACPTALQDMSAALDQIGDKAKGVVPIFITVDPDRDTPDQLKGYAENFYPGLVSLTGKPDEIAAVAKAYRVYYKKASSSKPGADDYLMDHSSLIYLMDKDGKYLAHFSHETPVEQIAAALAKYAS